MKNKRSPAIWKLLKNIVNDLYKNREFTLEEITKEFENRHPDKRSINVKFDIKKITVNSPTRLSYLYIYGKPNPDGINRHPRLKGSFSEYPRISNTSNECDILYLEGDKYEIYNPSKHGIFEIALDGNDVNSIVRRDASFDAQVQSFLKLSQLVRLEKISQSNKIPEKITTTVTTFKRNPAVVAEVLFLANGICHDCSQRAPFNKKKR